MEFNYENWSYEPDNEEVEKARKEIVIEDIKWEISRKTKQKKFSDKELNMFKIIAEFIIGGQFENINDDEFMYDEFKDYFYNNRGNYDNR